MARIQNYNIDSRVTDGDKFIGSDAAGNVTRNYKASDIAAYLNNYGKIGISGQISYKFTTNVAPRTWGTISFPLGAGDGTDFSDITTIVASKYNAGQIVISDLLQYLEGKSVFIFDLLNPNNFGEYLLETITVRSGEIEFFDLGLLFLDGNGSLSNDVYYGTLISPNTITDKEFIHVQSVSSDEWVINHSMNKYPSVTVQDSAGSIVIGEITYNNKNTITLTFSGAFSGNAYLN